MASSVCAFRLTKRPASTSALWPRARGFADSIVAYNNPNPALATVSRPICKYPDKLVFKGGSTSVAANFTCQQQPNDDFFTSDLALPDLGANNGVGQLQTLNK